MTSTWPRVGASSACLDNDQLLAWIEGHLAADQRERALAHLASRESCRAATSALARMEPTQPSSVECGDPDGEEPAFSVEIGSKIGHFEVLQVIGRGGMGVVVRARDLELGRDCRQRGGE